MAPSRSGMVRQNNICTPYNLRSMLKSSSSSPATSSKSSSPNLNAITSVHDMVHLELKTTRDTVFKIGTLLSAEVKQLRKFIRSSPQLSERPKRLLWSGTMLLLHIANSYILLTLYCIVPFAKQLWSGLSLNWFHESIRTRLSSCYEPLPQNFKDHAEPFTSAEVDMLCDGIYAIIPGRFYHCPICRAFVDEPPIEVPLLRNLFSEINGALGPEVERTEQVSTDPALQWKIFFRKRRAKQKRCTCEVFGCINEQYKDPTRVDLPGRLLPHSTVQKHKQQEIIYQAQKRQNNLDAIFIAATMTDRMAVDDTSMLSGQIGDDGDDCQWHHDGTLPGQKTADAERGSTCQCSLRELLHSHISRFSFPPAGLMFMEKPTTISGPDPGPLDPKGSSDFVKHQLAIDKVLEMVDSVSCEGDDSARALRKSLVHDIQAHQAYLDNFILENWQRQKAASVALPLEVQHQLPIVLDNMFGDFVPISKMKLKTTISCLEG
ncbi:hypothetical protein BD769DRAFT_1395482 [Suillus cothurnatus]|nr:hypothetical protein BD769DRAFT_1395482 [Suillus cothurnatus]